MRTDHNSKKTHSAVVFFFFFFNYNRYDTNHIRRYRDLTNQLIIIFYKDNLTKTLPTNCHNFLQRKFDKVAYRFNLVIYIYIKFSMTFTLVYNCLFIFLIILVNVI